MYLFELFMKISKSIKIVKWVDSFETAYTDMLSELSVHFSGNY